VDEAAVGQLATGIKVGIIANLGVLEVGGGYLYRIEGMENR
jgi:hypothetical protein